MTTQADINSSASETSLAGSLVDAVSVCVPVLGTEEFTERFLDVVRLTGAGQVTAFAYEPEKVNCLLSRNFLAEDKGGTLAAAYIDGWFREDPLFERAMAMGENDCAVVRLDDLLPQLNARYLAMFFGAPGFRTKISILVAQAALRMALNFYFVDDFADRSIRSSELTEPGLSRLIGRTLATHFLRLNLPMFPLPLAVLSERERQVCIGMLAGKKTEIIAEEIGVAPSSVVTYRQRAYQKLGIASRGELFSICRS